jgi:hypothetical protein
MRSDLLNQVAHKFITIMKQLYEKYMQDNLYFADWLHCSALEGSLCVSLVERLIRILLTNQHN